MDRWSSEWSAAIDTGMETNRCDGTLTQMNRKPAQGLFITGTDTGVGKTYVAAGIARGLHASGCRVGVYKPAASGCSRQGDRLVSEDAVRLWEAAGRPDSQNSFVRRCLPCRWHLTWRPRRRT